MNLQNISNIFKTKNTGARKLVLAVIIVAALTLTAAAVLNFHSSTSSADSEGYFYVDSGKTAWTGITGTAYTDPQAAIDAAAQWSSISGYQAYVLVASGTFTVTDTSLSLKDNVTVIGGFAGTETSLTESELQGWGPSNATGATTFDGDNLITVFANTNIGPTAVLQNVVITNGFSDYGGGMNNDNSSPTLTNCTFSNNIASWSGGGMYNSDSSPRLTNCTFADNGAVNSSVSGMDIKRTAGGGMENYCDTIGSSPTLINCTFSDNTTFPGYGNGGGISNLSGCDSTIINCVFTNNSGYYSGGGIYNAGNAVLINCTFSANRAPNGGDNGAGIFNNTGGTISLFNCAFTGNVSSGNGNGGGMANYGYATLVNCTLINNASNGVLTGNVGAGGIYNSGTLNLINSILVFNKLINGTDTNSVIDNANSDLINDGTAVIKSSIIGARAYDSSGASSPIGPAATDFNADGSLTYNVPYAAKQGDFTLYSNALDTYGVLSILSDAYGYTVTIYDLKDINGTPIVDANGVMDIGAFRYPGMVTSVTVSPSDVMIRKGQTQQFTAVVAASGGATQNVIWSVDSTSGSSIDRTGLLTVAPGETKSTLVVTATSAEDSTQFDNATVTVLETPPATTTVTANAGYGGSISNSDLVYTVTPDAGFVIDQVFVDGVDQTLSDRTTLEIEIPNDGNPHSIFATFGYTVNFNVPTNGTLSVTSAGSSVTNNTLVHGGQDLIITATPNSGYVLASLTINGEDFSASYSGSLSFTVGDNGATRTLLGGDVVSAAGANIEAAFSAVSGATAITSSDNASFSSGAGGTFQVTATGTTPITFSLSGQPSGVTINSTSGLITVANTVPPNVYYFDVIASNGVSPNATQSFTLSVTAVGPPPLAAISASTLGSFGSLQTPYTQPIAKTVTITNTGTGTVSLQKPISTNYIIGDLSVTSIGAGETATFTVQPKAGLPVGNYDETIDIYGSDSTSTSVFASFTVTAATPPTSPTYSISASALGPFGSLQSPYTQPAAQTVTVTNTGTGTVGLTQPASTDYIIGNLSATTLATGGKATFTVQPRSGLPVGNYDETITISGSGGASATISASFTVTSAAGETDIIFTAAQKGGTSGSADSTGIILSFSQSVTGLTAGDITIADGTGSAVKGSLTGSGATWTISLASVTTEGTVSVSVGNFGTFHVTNDPQTVNVFKNTAGGEDGSENNGGGGWSGNTVIVVAVIAVIIACLLIGGAYYFLVVKKK